MLLLQNYICNSLPLFARWVHAGWVVSTCMKKEDGSLRCGLKGREEARKVKTDSFGVVVWVVYRFNTNVL